MLGLYGGADQGIPNDTVEKMFAALKAAGNAEVEIVDLPGHAARLQRRLPAELPQGARPRTAGSGSLAWFKLHLGLG